MDTRVGSNPHVLQLLTRAQSRREEVPMQFDESDRYEAIAELTHLFVVIQASGRRLANDTHGLSYDLTQEMNTLLRVARAKLDQIEAESFGSSPAKADRRASISRRGSDSGFGLIGTQRQADDPRAVPTVVGEGCDPRRVS